jgi:hypothetical protein
MMRYFRRLPLRAQALWLLALLFWLVALGMTMWTLVLSREHQELATARWQTLALAFFVLALACNWLVATYDSRPWLSTWRGQLAAALGFTALPLGSVAVALLIPPNSPFFGLTFLLGLLAVLAAYVWVIVRRVA